jgi:hypothetical protein
VSQPRVPGGLETVVRQLVGGRDAEERDHRASTFARGLALGALVGAAIAGSTIWQRRTANRTLPSTGRPTEPSPDEPSPAESMPPAGD